MQQNVTTVLQTMRIPFLILAPVAVFLGMAIALQQTQTLNTIDLILVFLGALLAHISVNMLNEYQDFRSGLDFKTTKTPFSGGSGGLVANPQAAKAVHVVALLSLGLTVAIGLYFIQKVGWILLPIGVLGVLLTIGYTNWFNRSPLACLLAPGLGFGPLIVVGTYIALTQHYSHTALLISLVPFLLSSNLLLLNQFPDIDADQSVGRRHIPIVYGKRISAHVYGVLNLTTWAVILGFFVTSMIPALALIALIPAIAGGLVYFGLLRHLEQNKNLIPYMGLNVVVSLTTPALLAIGIMFG